MKVNVYVTEDVTDAERKEISELLGVKLATRDQLKEFLWNNGAKWRYALGAIVPEVVPVPSEMLDGLI